jgi:hypothetical protein
LEGWRGEDLDRLCGQVESLLAAPDANRVRALESWWKTEGARFRPPTPSVVPRKPEPDTPPAEPAPPRIVKKATAVLIAPFSASASLPPGQATGHEMALLKAASSNLREVRRTASVPGTDAASFVRLLEDEGGIGLIRPILVSIETTPGGIASARVNVFTASVVLQVIGRDGTSLAESEGSARVTEFTENGTTKPRMEAINEAAAKALGQLDLKKLFPR